MRTVVAIFALAVAAGAAEPGQKDVGSLPSGNILPRIVQGAGWSTEIQILNTDDERRSIPYTIGFFNADGSRMPVLPAGSAPSDEVSSLAGVVPFRGVHFVTLPNFGGLRAGYASIESSGAGGVMVNSVLTQTVPGRPDFQMTIPSLGKFTKRVRLVFRNSRPFVTALAITSASPQSWTLRAFDSAGLELCRSEQTMERDEHRAFLVNAQLPCTAGGDGLLEIEAGFVGGTVVGIVAHDFGPFSVQIPYDICCAF